MLAGLRGVRVCVVSGRAQPSLAAWLGKLPIDLVAEHGVWSKRSGIAAWKCHIDPTTLGWLADARAILETYVERAPGRFWRRRPPASPGTTAMSTRIWACTWRVSCACT